MITKAQATAAWQTVMAFSMSNSEKTSFSKEDIGELMKNAIMTLNEYFNQKEEGEK